MNDDPIIDEQEALRCLDRLADGELHGGSRRALFEWLDSDPIRWRSCALLLLETRELQSAFGDWMTEASTAQSGRTADTLHNLAFSGRPTDGSHHRPAIQIGWRVLSCLAAVVLVAFGLGIAADRRWNAESLHGDGIATAKPAPADNDAAHPRNRDQQPMADQSRQVVDSSDVIAGEMAAIPDYVRGQLERCGYQVNSQQKVISVTLPDGQQVSVPVEEWNFQYAGGRVY